MPRPSDRIMTLNDAGDDGWGVFYAARARVAQGDPVIELTIGEHDIGTDPAILQEMHRAALAGHTGYAAVPGIASLRRAVADRVQTHTGVPTAPENVLITPGGQAALFAAHAAALDPGDAALFIDPYYATYPGTIRGCGARAVAVPTRAADAFLPDATQLRRSARDHAARSLLINTPNNPTGTVYPRETLQDIAQVVQDHDMWLISDEVYDTQVWQGAHLSPRALPGMDSRCIVIGSMSKSHAMTGSRLGWCIAPAELTEAMIALATSTTYGVPGFIQEAALFALSQGDALEQRIAAPFARRRALAQRILAGQRVVSLVPSGGAMYLFLDIRATGLSGQAFATRLLAAHDIAVMPGESFGACAAGHVRVALTVADDRLAEALHCLCRFAAACAADADAPA